MGLDMYIYKKTYVKNWEHNGPEGQHKVTVRKNNKILKHIKPNRISEIVEEVAYWRKANHIHKWFVQEVQSGEDDCGNYHVEIEKLKELQSICQVIVDYFEKSIVRTEKKTDCFNNDYEEVIYDIDESVLVDLLPTASGFFFGGTDYDHWYYLDTKETIEMINDAIEGIDSKDWSSSFEYHSSW